MRLLALPAELYPQVVFVFCRVPCGTSVSITGDARKVKGFFQKISDFFAEAKIDPISLFIYLYNIRTSYGYPSTYGIAPKK